jgi:cell division protein FtsW
VHVRARRARRRARARAARERSAARSLDLRHRRGLVAIGLVMVFSASSATAYATYHDTAYFLKRQLVWLAIGGVVRVHRVSRRLHEAQAHRAGARRRDGLLLLLVLTLIPHVGLQTGGARRWLG